jgi:hypothetical protein
VPHVTLNRAAQRLLSVNKHIGILLISVRYSPKSGHSPRTYEYASYGNQEGSRTRYR